MKKIINVIICCLILSGICLGVSAAIGYIPSKSTADMTQIEVAVENPDSDSAFFIKTDDDEDSNYQEYAEICQQEITKIAESGSVEEYFGTVIDTEGKEMNIKEILGTDTVNVFEFCPIIADGYEEKLGAVTVNLLFATPYKENEKVVVLIGIVTENTDGTHSIAWKGYEGIGIVQEDGAVENSGRIQVKLDAQTIMRIQEGYALLAIASK